MFSSKCWLIRSDLVTWNGPQNGPDTKQIGFLVVDDPGLISLSVFFLGAGMYVLHYLPQFESLYIYVTYFNFCNKGYFTCSCRFLDWVPVSGIFTKGHLYPWSPTVSVFVCLPLHTLKTVRMSYTCVHAYTSMLCLNYSAWGWWAFMQERCPKWNGQCLNSFSETHKSYIECTNSWGCNIVKLL